MNMRVAVAGTCGLALLIAREINDETSHQLVILSRTVSAPTKLVTARLFNVNLHQAPIGLDISGVPMSSCRL
jgi:hypothetical protein